MTVAQPAQRPRLFQAMVDAFRQEDVRRKLLFTVAMLIVFRFVAHVPVPNVDRDALALAFEGNSILDFLSIFSGGALQNLSVAALGVYPYITASIIMQVLSLLLPQLRALQEEGEQGRRRIQVYTHWLAVPMAFVQGYGQILFINQQSGGLPVVRDFGFQNDFIGTWATLVHARRGHDVPGLAWRTHHRKRHRQRHLAHHLRRYRRRNPGPHPEHFHAVHPRGTGHRAASRSASPTSSSSSRRRKGGCLSSTHARPLEAGVCTASRGKATSRCA